MRKNEENKILIIHEDLGKYLLVFKILCLITQLTLFFFVEKVNDIF